MLLEILFKEQKEGGQCFEIVLYLIPPKVCSVSFLLYLLNFKKQRKKYSSRVTFYLNLPPTPKGIRYYFSMTILTVFAKFTNIISMLLKCIQCTLAFISIFHDWHSAAIQIFRFFGYSYTSWFFPKAVISISMASVTLRGRFLIFWGPCKCQEV